MHSLRRWILPMGLVLAGWLVATGLATADNKNKETQPPREVDDTNGKLFSASAKTRANAIIADLKRNHNKDFYVETFATAPDEYRGKADQWAADRFKRLQVSGVYVLICKEPRHPARRNWQQSHHQGELLRQHQGSKVRELMVAKLEASQAKGLTDKERQAKRDEERWWMARLTCSASSTSSIR